MSSQVNIHEAKTHFSRLIQRVQGGEEIVIAKAGKPVALLTPVKPTAPGRRVPGTARGEVDVPADFDAPLPEDLRRHFEP